MAFTQAHTKWLSATQQSAINYDEITQKQDARNVLLAAVTGEISDLQDDLMDASDDLKVEWKREKFLGLFDRSNKSMDWKNGDRDDEVDTKHDLKDDYMVDDEAVRKLTKLHEKLFDLQSEMENAKDADGNPLFTPADITRELWTPLVQADVIPSNAVADKYSQEAQVFNGACEIYQDKLTDYSKTASKYTNAKRAIKIGTDVISLMGSLAGDAIKIDSFEAQSMSRQDMLTLAQDNADKTAGVATPAQLENIEKMNGLKQQARDAALQVAAVTMTTTVLTGGLGILDSTLDKPEDGRRRTFAAGIAKQAFNALGSAASAAISVHSANVVASDATTGFSSAFQTQMNIASKSVTALIAGGNTGFALFSAAMKFSDGDYNGGVAGITEALQGIAAAVGASFAAGDVKRGTDDQGNMVLGDQAQWQQMGLTIQAAILAGSNIPAIAKHLADVVASDGGKVDLKVILANVGFSAISASLAGAMPAIAGGTYTVVAVEDVEMGSDNALFQKTQAEYDSFNNDADAAQGLGETAKPGLGMETPVDSPEALMAQKKFLAEQENARKARAMSDFKADLQDPAKKEEFFAQIEDASAREMEVLNELLEDAGQSPQDLDTVEKEQKAMAAMDKLLAEARSCNMKWQALEVITGVGAAAVAAALPGAGLAVAIQKLLIDATTLVRKSYQLNKWMDNMALTVGNSSVYGPAINGRLNSARVQVSLQVLRVLYDALGVAAESIKLADASGVSMGGGTAAGVGIQVGTSMARALTEFAYKIQKEAEIEAGWQLYQIALKSPGDRKRARTAMKWNSTLSKCVIAYGIVIDGDPIAKEVGRSCGITPEVLADQKNVCQKVVSYFETLYSDDPQILKRVPIKKDWHPGTPSPTLVSWLRFKGAAAQRAIPPLSEASLKTPEIDRQLSLLVALLGPDSDYAAKRDTDFPEFDISNPARETPAYGTFLDDVAGATKGLIAALRSYAPKNAEPGEGGDWIGGAAHADFVAVVESLTAQTQMIEGEVANDKKRLAEFLKQRQATLNAAAQLDDDADDSVEDDDQKDDGQ
ncbi:hypothetical protein [Sulfitobacter geojensis]|uniref:hypothetical protein n=1 Tax=Sulfitobacter geojensis TaxID=1342299 RepID=UPI00046A6E4C|nr:hypothetical protein [Sulfitobacter geojensis]KHA51217.1 hypothetical protein Z947_1500 [Sulfitobacter geojensis]NYI26427.1 hypothetical protein [Sulfitobacter geojensis]